MKRIASAKRRTVMQVIPEDVALGIADGILEVQGVDAARLESIRRAEGGVVRVNVANAGMVVATVDGSLARNGAASVGAADEGEREYESGQNK